MSQVRSSLARHRRPGNDLTRFDSLPAPLRRWMAQAALPWSARSCWRIWSDVHRRGGGEREALERLALAERRTLQRDTLSGH
ncbi:hypothetical protein KUH32_09365 [Thalassococcus sp. CAU 1522]|uniref:Uncharacterized protein n=1 Tax=Thalassococcus arenae TaxID=2851652 RepID=A0ABS6N851_9RHOB|nr:DUF6525 family protein [Thalassococcus arenae]MBV2359983.1 hypothetical protein [Thalassococcus arenae]